MGGHIYHNNITTSRWNLTILKTVLESLKSGLPKRGVKLEIFILVFIGHAIRMLISDFAQTLHEHDAEYINFDFKKFF